MGILGRELTLFQQVASAIGETLEAVCNMQDKERRELISVLGLEMVEEKAEAEDQTVKDEVENIWVSSDEDVEEDERGTNVSFSNMCAGGNGSGRTAEGGGGAGWGECPMCEQLLPLPTLQLHSMVCQGIAYNGGEGLEVNPMDVQTKCKVCSCLIPELVYDEHKETCWANTDNRRRIATPMERRKEKYGTNRGWATAPKK